MDKLVSLSIYFLAVAILAEILEFPLHSVLAFGGVSGVWSKSLLIVDL